MLWNPSLAALLLVWQNVWTNSTDSVCSLSYARLHTGNMSLNLAAYRIIDIITANSKIYEFLFVCFSLFKIIYLWKFYMCEMRELSICKISYVQILSKYYTIILTVKLDQSPILFHSSMLCIKCKPFNSPNLETSCNNAYLQLNILK